MIQPQTEADEQTPEPVVIETITDYYLVLLTTLLENLGEGSNLGITLNTTGGLVYGDLITHDAWEKLWISGVTEASDFVGDVFSQVLQARREEEAADGDDGSGPVRYLHLKNATSMSGTDKYRVGLWRGSLAQVAGWSMGKPND